MNTSQAAKILWKYHQLGMRLKKADCIFVLSSHDLRVADHAALLYKQGWAPKLIISGGIAHKGDLLETPWDEPEAVVFARRARALGVPKKDILLERKARNTGENILFSKPLLQKLKARRAIIVQKPTMERRAYATCRKLMPALAIIITSPPIPFDRYPTRQITKDVLINIMIGDTQRIIEYPKKGFQIRQRMPAKVKEAYAFLIKKGYTKHLMRD